MEDTEEECQVPDRDMEEGGDLEEVDQDEEADFGYADDMSVCEKSKQDVDSQNQEDKDEL